MQKAIDAHIHLSERKDDALNGYAKGNGMKYTLEGLLEDMSRHRIEHGLLLSPPLQGGRPLPNERILEFCRRSRRMLSPIVTVEPSKKEVAAALELTRTNRSEVKGFKIRLGYIKEPAASPAFDDVYDYAEAEGLPVLFHTGDTASSDGDLMQSHPLTIDRLANSRENLVIILCHFGNPWFQDAAELIYKHPNVYADISGLTTGGGAYPEKFAKWLADRISEAIYFAGGAEKVIFGTDYPVTSYEDALGLVGLLDVDESDKELMLRRNAKRVFNL